LDERIGRIANINADSDTGRPQELAATAQVLVRLTETVAETADRRPMLGERDCRRATSGTAAGRRYLAGSAG